jgi:hypothetical protein
MPPMNAPVPPPAQPDFTKANSGAKGVAPAGFQTEVVMGPAPIANGAGTAPARLPLIK